MVDVVVAAVVGIGAGGVVWSIDAVPVRPMAAAPMVAVLGLWWSSALVAVVGPLLVAIAVAEHRRRIRVEGARRLSRQYPVVLDRLVQRLRSGHSLHTVVAELDAGPDEISTLLAPAARALRAGCTLEAAVETLVAGGRTDRRVELLAATLGTLARNGGPAVPALQRLRFTLIGFVQAEDEAAAHAGQALASAALLAVAPGLFSVVVAVVDADARRLYVHEPIGAACVAGAVVLSYSGWRWMSRAVGRAAGPGPIGRPR